MIRQIKLMQNIKILKKVKISLLLLQKTRQPLRVLRLLVKIWILSSLEQRPSVTMTLLLGKKLKMRESPRNSLTSRLSLKLRESHTKICRTNSSILRQLMLRLIEHSRATQIKLKMKILLQLTPKLWPILNLTKSPYLMQRNSSVNTNLISRL